MYTTIQFILKHRPPFARVEFHWRKREHLHNAGSPPPCRRRLALIASARTCNTWDLTLRDPSWLALPIVDPNMVLRPDDISMQIWADNDAKPHNQQIINSPSPLPRLLLDFLALTPVPHVEKGTHACCTTSDLLRCWEVNGWLQHQAAPTC